MKLRIRNRTEPAPDLFGGRSFTHGQVTAMFVATVVAVVLFPIGARAAQQLLGVVITDPTTPANKAHVDSTGHLSVAGNLALSGNVGIDPSANAVQVANPVATPAFVSDVSDPDRQTFAKTISVNSLINGIIAADVVTVPVGKRLVIRYASGDIRTTSGEPVVNVNFQDATASPNTNVFFVPTLVVDTGTFDFWTFGQDLYVAYDAGHEVVLNVSYVGSHSASGDIGVSGYLIDCTATLPCN